MKPGLWHLTVALHSIEECILHFSEYAITGSRDEWTIFAWKSFFGFNFAHILDDRSVERLELVDRVHDFHDRLHENFGYSSTPNSKYAKRILLILTIMKKEVTRIWCLEVNRQQRLFSIKPIAYVLQTDEDEDLNFIVPYFIQLQTIHKDLLRKDFS